MIDLSDTTSWPHQLRRFLDQVMSSEAQALSTDWPFNKCTHHDTLRHRRRIKDEVETLLQEFEIMGFHCTRVIDPESILLAGLEPLKPEVQISRILSAFRMASVSRLLLSEVEEALETCRNGEGFANREGLLWFTLHWETTNTGDCKELLKYFGGEMLRHAVDSVSPEIFPVLASLGVPCVIEARLPIRIAMPHHLSALAEEVMRIAATEFLGHPCPLRCCDLAVRHPIRADRIIAIKEKRA